MTVDLSQLTASEYREVELGGLAYKVGPLTMAEWGGVMAWIKANCPSPMTLALRSMADAEAAGVTVSPENRKYLLDSARAEERAWPPQTATAEWFAALDNHPDGQAAWLHAVLAKHQPSLTPEQAAGLPRFLTPDLIAKLVSIALLGVEPIDPKAKPPAKASGGASGRRRRRTTGAKSGSGSPGTGGGTTPRSRP